MTARFPAASSERKWLPPMTIADTDDRLIYPGTEARHLLGGIGTTTFHALINAGHLERVHIGRRAFITAESLHAYVDRLRETA